MDWPFVENKNNFLFDYHLVYGGVLIYLISKRAGHVFGLDGWIEQTPFLARHPALRPLTS
jgi:thiosulfate dehydrogenase [quinone] large subunit